MIAERGEGRVPDWQLEKAIKTWDFRKKNFKMLLEKGVKMSFGSDAGCPFIRQAMTTSTSCTCLWNWDDPDAGPGCRHQNSAECIGIEDKTGTLESGKLADVL